MVAKTLTPKTQMQLWQEFVQTKDLEYPSFCDLVRLMIAIPPYSGWVERAYSKLEQICQKRRNRMSVDHLKSSVYACNFESGTKGFYELSK